MTNIKLDRIALERVIEMEEELKSKY